MTSDQRFERDLPELLARLAPEATPAYRDHVVQRTARMRQRPAWTFPERWLPVSAVTSRLAVLPRMPGRMTALAALILLILAVVVVIAIGSQPRVPAPFGLARNGLIAFTRDGDIYTADPETGLERAVVTGPDTDLRPIFSLDGTRLAFERRTADPSNAGRVFVVATDGSRLTEVTRDPLPQVNTYAFSPDGREILIWSGPGLGHRIHVANADGSGVRAMVTAIDAWDPAWRPPDGAEILFSGTTQSAVGLDRFEGLYALDARRGGIRTILEPLPGWYRGNAIWSSDGSRIAYIQWIAADHITAESHIINADGSGDRLLTQDPAASWQALRAWSNDGTRMLVVRGYRGEGGEETHAAIVPVDGGSLGVEVDYVGPIQPECCSSWEWAPDDSVILGTPTDSSGLALSQVMIDPATGTSWTVPWSATSYPAWQRLAP